MKFVLIFATVVLPGSLAQFAVHLQESGEFKLEYMQYKDPVALPDKFSVCFRFQLGLERGPSNYIFSYSLPGNYDELNFYIRPETRTGSICLEDSCGEFSLTGDLRSGYSLICILVKDMYSQSTSVELFYDGKLAVSLIVNTIIPGGDEITQGILILGQEQDMHGGGFDIKQSFSGLISQFNIFNRIITELQIQAMQDCSNELSGELVSWDNFSWLIQGDINLYPIEDTSIYCRTSLLAELVSVPEPLDFSAADFTCNFLGGRIQAPGKELSLLRQFIDD
ncbi:neuronal pentraxin-2 [Eurytemora carolleeae]|uniref:neuronal pentraxin-2 n=1 Tax=Eurytemora carolleeae TaxID=1294199 RepID=UPI000C791604|nr:neuronal pentraxin-2 [Eurytemora carolleeae]|eukprot:XP_023348146.1 neuronal pentraxin-2-like [Eurytemora affinis]